MAKKLLQRNDKRVIGRVLRRAYPIERDQIKYDDEKRTIEMSFSSDKPIEHWFGRLILNHSPKAIRLDRLRAGGPFLCDHDRTKLAGVHEEVDTDGHVMRGSVRFSRSALGTETYEDIRDGIRPNTSVGLILHEFHLVREDEDEGPLYQSDDWEPVEDSSVTVPADFSVGAGRALGLKRDGGVDEEEDETCAACDGDGCSECEPDSDADDEEEQSKNSGGERAAQTQTIEARKAMDEDKLIMELGEMLGQVELAREFVAEGGKTAADFRKAVRDLNKAKKAGTQTPPEDPNAAAQRNGGNVIQIGQRALGRLKSFKGERAAEKDYRFGMFLLAGPMSRAASDGLRTKAQTYCREQGIVIARAHSESDNESGGFLVPTEFEAVMIDLREQFGIFRKFANVVPMNTDSKQRPRRKGGLTAYPIGAKGSSRRLTESKKAWDLVELFARKWGVLAKYEEELSEDAVISMADDMAYEIAYAFTVIEDECGFLGDGSSDYHGITGVINKLKGLSNTVGNIAGLVVGSGNTWDELTRQDFLKVIGRLPQYADTPNARWFCSKTFWAEVMVNIILAAGGVTAAEVEGARVKTFMGYPVEIAQVLPKAEANSQIPVLFGDLAKGAMFGDRRGVTIKLTDSNDTDFEEDLMSIKGTERFDINVHDVGNADATASKREPGPIVGLITAAA